MSEALHIERRGGDGPSVLLLHGLGCNGAVWNRTVPLLLQHGFATVVPDAPGHGRSQWRPSYSVGQMAAALRDVIAEDRPVHVIGHSMGAAIALVLASGMFGVEIASVTAIGMKVVWSEDDRLRLSRVPPMRLFADRHDAAQRFLRVTGLEGLLAPDDPCVDQGIVAVDGGFRLAADPRTGAVAGAPIRGIPTYGQAAIVRVRHCCGSDDPLVDVGTLRTLDPHAIAFAGHGHNAHVSAAPLVVDAFLRHVSSGQTKNGGTA